MIAAWTSSCTRRRRWRWRTRRVSTSASASARVSTRSLRSRRSTRRCPTTAPPPPTRCACSTGSAARRSMASTGGRYFGFVNGAALPVALGAAWIGGGVGPERRPAGDVSGRGHAPRGRLATGWSTCSACPPAPGRRSSAAPPWPTRRASPPPVTSCSPRRMGRASRRAVRRPADLGGRRRAGPLDAVEVARARRARPQPRGRGARRRPGSAASRRAARTRRAGARLRPGRRGEHRRLRPVRRDRRLARRAGGLAPRRRRLRAVGARRPERGPSSSPGSTGADSWATDAHKWLNVTYDCGIAFVRDPAALRRTFAAVAGYLPPGDRFEAMHHTPQSSQRARQVEVWAVLRTLGRRGVAELVARACECATVIADRLRAGGLTILNDVVLNQVLVRLGDGRRTDALIAAIQADGRIWCGPTQWGGETAMRISVSSLEDRPRRCRARRRRDPRTGRRAGRGGTPWTKPMIWASGIEAGPPGRPFDRLENRVAPHGEGARSQRERSLVPQDRRDRRRVDLGAAQGRDRRAVVVVGRDPDRLVERGEWWRGRRRQGVVPGLPLRDPHQQGLAGAVPGVRDRVSTTRRPR